MISRTTSIKKLSKKSPKSQEKINLKLRLLLSFFLKIYSYVDIFYIRNEKTKVLKIEVSYRTAIFSHNIMESVTIKLQCNRI